LGEQIVNNGKIVFAHIFMSKVDQFKSNQYHTYRQYISPASVINSNYPGGLHFTEAAWPCSNLFSVYCISCMYDTYWYIWRLKQGSFP